MPPQFSDPQLFDQAERLMQPSLLRLLDQLRRQVAASAWTHRFETLQLWADTVPESVQQQWQSLGDRLESSNDEAEIAVLQEQLAQLPQPTYAYQLWLNKGELSQQFDLWELCYQTCFANHQPNTDYPPQIRPGLLDEAGEVDWEHLDLQARHVVEDLISRLEQNNP
jgi:hypothetical protein